MKDNTKIVFCIQHIAQCLLPPFVFFAKNKTNFVYIQFQVFPEKAFLRFLFLYNQKFPFHIPSTVPKLPSFEKYSNIPQ